MGIVVGNFYLVYINCYGIDWRIFVIVELMSGFLDVLELGLCS